MLWTPTVLPANAPAHQFSEIRALHHVAALASYERQVSTAGVERAATYIHDEALRLARLAADTRPDLVVEVLREQTSGAVGFELFGASLTNIYHNITNIAVRVSTASSTTSSAKAFLINAHFDSTLGSSGASDCASCVGIALEALRALVQGHQQPRAPVVFLLNGGEETFMQGAAGFASSSAWRDDIGAFFNLESTGTHGLPILFQHTASWAVDVYARSAPAPRGTALSQDFFNTGLIPADTDYKMFADPQAASIPGIDVAYVLGGAVYHTSRDAVDNLRPGTLQELGETVMGCMWGFTDALADAAADGAPALPSHDDGAYYFDLFWFMVRYSKAHVGPWLHGAAFLAVALLPVAVAMMYKRPVLHTCCAVADAMRRYLLAVGGAVVLPMLVGALRASVLGNPMVFFAHHWAGYVMYLPFALIGAMAPLTLLHTAHPPLEVDIATMGAAWAWALAGAIATHLKLGVAIYPFLWTAPLCFLVPLLPSLRASRQLLVLLVGTVPATIVGVSSMLTLLEHLMGRFTMAGAHPGLLGVVVADAALGALMGVGAVFSFGILLPAYAAAAGKAVFSTAASAAAATLSKGTRVHSDLPRRVVMLLLLTGTIASCVCTARLHPYGVDHPKRMYLQHLHTVGADEGVHSFYVAATTDVHPVKPLLRDAADAWVAGDDMLRFAYPLTDKLQAMAMPAPGTDILQGALPTLHLTQRTHLPATNHTRLHFTLDTIKPCWAIVRLQGAMVHRWSLSDTVTQVGDGQHGGAAHMLRFAGNHEAGRRLSMWVDVAEDAEMQVQLTAKYLEGTPALSSFGAQFAAHVDVTGITVVHADWDVMAATGGVARSWSAVPRVGVMHNASEVVHTVYDVPETMLCGAGVVSSAL